MRRITVILVSLLAVVGCSSGSSSKSAATTSTTGKGTGTTCTSSTTVAGSDSGAEVNPPGDIPDDQAFVAHTPAAATYTLQVPEGWASTEAGDHVTFTDKLNTIDVDVVTAAAAPTVASAKADEVPRVAKQAPCFTLVDVTTAKRKAGEMVVIKYTAESKPDPVTDKVVLDDVERYEIWKDGKEAILTLSGPAGSDNVDPWRIVTDSFRWT